MKKIEFIIGYGKKKDKYIAKLLKEEKTIIEAQEIHHGQECYVDELLSKIKDKFVDIDELYLNDYKLIDDNHYVINNYLKNNYKKIKITANVFLNQDFNKCTSQLPTIYDRFDIVKLHNSKKLLKGLINNPYQGYALYYKDDKKEINEFNGFENYQSLNMINENSNFRLASVSKQFIGYSTMLLIKQNKIQLDTKLFDLFNDLPEYTKNITIQMLLNHTSGLPDYEDYKIDKEQLSDYDVLDFVRETKSPLFESGTKYQYSNTAYVILGLIIEKKSYTKLGLFIKNYVFDNIGMENSTINYQNETVIKNRVYGYKIVNGKMEKNDQSYTSATIGDGGIYSSINDLKKWIKYLRENKNILNDMVKDYALNNNKDRYGFGLKIRIIKYNDKEYQLYCHSGSTIGTNTFLGFVPELNMEFVFLTNQNILDAEDILKNIFG